MKLIPCSGRFTEVDDSDFETASQYTWCVKARSDKKGFSVYRYIKIKQGKYKTERLGVFLMRPKDGEEVGYRDGNGLNNQRENLFCGTHQQQCFKQKKQCSGKYPYKGVTKTPLIHGKYQPKKPWMARIRHNGKLINIGYFFTVEEAALAYNVKAAELFGDLSVINEKIENPGTYVDHNEVTDRDIKVKARAAKHVADHGTPCRVLDCDIVALASHGLCYIHGSHQARWAKGKGRSIGWNVNGWLSERTISSNGRMGVWRSRERGVNCLAKECKNKTVSSHGICERHHATYIAWSKRRAAATADGMKLWLSEYRPRNIEKNKCVVSGCQKIVRTATGLCRKHHHRAMTAKGQVEHALASIEHTERRRFRKANAGVFLVTKCDLMRLRSRQRNMCYICSKELIIRPHIDHIIPLARGGRHSIGNLAISCAKCNLKKNDRLLIEFKYGITSYRYRVKRKLAAKATATVAA